MDSTFEHKYTFDLSSSWTLGKWWIQNNIVYLTPELILDTLQILNDKNQVLIDTLVLSSDPKKDRIENDEYVASSLSGGGQNRFKPPNKLYWKRNKLYVINECDSLDLRSQKRFSSKKCLGKYFKRETRK